MTYKTLLLSSIFLILLFTACERLAVAAEITITPAIDLRAEYDDNIDFEDTDEQDDFSGIVVPKFMINYSTELISLNTNAEAEIQRYLNQTDFDNEKYRFGVNGEYQASQRWKFLGNFDFIKDETLDSQLEETGRAFEREKRKDFITNGGIRYQMTELTDIGPDFTYRKVIYNGDSTDFDLYVASLPIRKKFKNQLDEIIIEPAYSKYDSDNEEADDYRLTIEWNHQISETLKSKIKGGPRYTETDDKNEDNNTSNWGAIGEVGLTKTGELFAAEARAIHDLRSGSDGTIIRVTRGYLNFRKAILEKFGARLYTNAVYSTEEGDTDSDDEGKTFFYEIQPSLYYDITANHSIELFYNYQNRKEYDEPGSPVTVRNRAWLAFKFSFPKTW